MITRSGLSLPMIRLQHLGDGQGLQVLGGAAPGSATVGAMASAVRRVSDA